MADPNPNPPPPQADKPSSESPGTRLAKLLPADLTAAFLSARAGLLSAMDETAARGPIFWTFIAILVISPFYFRYVVKALEPLRIMFLSATFAVFAISIAYKNFSAYLTQFQSLSAIDALLTATAIVLPILWVFLLAPIVLDKLEEMKKP